MTINNKHFPYLLPEVRVNSETLYLAKYQSKKYWYSDTRHSQAEAKIFKTIETYIEWNTFFGSCHMQLLHVNTNLHIASLDFTSLCPNELNVTWYNTWLQKPLSFYKWGHRSVNISIIFNFSLHIHIVSEIKLNFLSHRPTHAQWESVMLFQALLS